MFWKKWLSAKGHDSSTEIMGTDMRAVVISDVGCVRTNNEDSARFIRPAGQDVRQAKGFLALVADGMGGHAAGEVASRLAVETISKVYFDRQESVEESLFLALTKANRSIWMAAGKDSKQKGMGTTCTAIAILNNRLYLAHVGDSRAYIFKNGQVMQLSKDHTYVQELVDQGVISASEADRHPERNVLTRAMGTHNKVEIDTSGISTLFEKEDRLLLCTDGLYDYLSKDELAQLLSIPSLSESAHAMIESAKQRGGHDNITVLLVEHIQPELLPQPRPTEQIS